MQTAFVAANNGCLRGIRFAFALLERSLFGEKEGKERWLEVCSQSLNPLCRCSVHLLADRQSDCSWMRVG